MQHSYFPKRTKRKKRFRDNGNYSLFLINKSLDFLNKCMMVRRLWGKKKSNPKIERNGKRQLVFFSFFTACFGADGSQKNQTAAFLKQRLQLHRQPQLAIREL